MKIIKNSLILLLASGLLYACGSKNDNAHSEEKPAEGANLTVQNPQDLALAFNGAAPIANGGSELYVVISGNNSCRAELIEGGRLESNSLYAGFIKTLNRTLAVNSPSQTIFACFEDKSETMYFYTTAESNPTMHPINFQALDQIALEHAANASRLHIIGFSYGGWRAIKLALHLSITTTKPISLISIDPISKLNCRTASDYGCRVAPQDFTPEERDILAQRTYWINFYQNFPLLRSGQIPEAEEEYLIPTPHFWMDSNRAVWRIIGKYFNRDSTFQM